MDLAEEIAKVVSEELFERAWRFVNRTRLLPIGSRFQRMTCEGGTTGGFRIRSRDRRRWTIDVMLMAGHPLWIRRMSWGREREGVRIPLADPRLLEKGRSTVMKYLKRAMRAQAKAVTS